METRNKYSVNTLKDTYYDIILQRIIHDEYKSGDIVTEKALVSEFDVSKSPIREALIALCSEGLLKSIPRFGYEVMSIPREKVQEMLEYRITMECGFLARNWDKLTTDQIRKLQDLLYRDYGQPEQMEALVHWKKNCNFHLELFSCYGNEYAFEQLSAVLRSLGIAYVRSYWNSLHMTNIRSTANRHKELIELLADGKHEAAIDCLRIDITEFFTTEHQ
jgi:DNA-binding GntR family transcriptional regulator